MGHIQIQKRIAIPCKILTFIEQYSIITIDVEEFDMLTKTNIEPIKKAVVAIKEMDADEEIRSREKRLFVTERRRYAFPEKRV